MTSKTKLPKELGIIIGKMFALIEVLCIAENAEELKTSEELQNEYFASEVVSNMKGKFTDSHIESMKEQFEVNKNVMLKDHKKMIFRILMSTALNLQDFLKENTDCLSHEYRDERL